MSALHSELIERSFPRQATAFEDPRINQTMTTEAAWVFDRLELRADDLLLDVAAGTGHAARQLAPSVAGVVALDTTEATLAAGRDEAKRAGLDNIDFLHGDAAAVPFPDGSFDVVVCRFAVHRFEEPEIQIAEMARCLRGGGRIAVADLISDPHPAVAASQNRLEWLRDPSHIRALPADELTNRLAAVGLTDIDVEIRGVERSLEPWLAQTEVSDRMAASIIAELLAEIDRGPATGFRPFDRDGELGFVQTLASVTAVKPS